VDTLFTRPTNQWKIINFSNPSGGGDAWFQGSGPNSTFTSYNGDTSAYAATNFRIGSSVSELSGMLLTPSVNIKNGDTLSFYTRVVTYDSGDIVRYPDRLIVRINWVDDGADSINDFGDGLTYLDKYDSVLVDINPTYDTANYPIGMPRVWTKITVPISKLTGANARPSRIAFHNYNLDGGPSGNNSNYFGIDAVRIISSGSGSSVNEVKSEDKFSVYPNPTNNYVFIKATDNNAITASVLSLDGKVLKTEILGTDGKMNIENLAPGFYNLKIENGGEVIYKKIAKK
jgi:Secretion system C-terminal sorting domain